MSFSSRLLILLFGAVIVAGCAGTVPMIALFEVKSSHVLKKSLSDEQIKESIIEGATNAGWVTQDIGNNNILATYRIRAHTVTVKIYYTQETFTAFYESSYLMKIACTRWEQRNDKYRVSGENSCPGNQPPTGIDVNYKTWVESLVASIKRSLATI